MNKYFSFWWLLLYFSAVDIIASKFTQTQNLSPLFYKKCHIFFCGFFFLSPAHTPIYTTHLHCIWLDFCVSFIAMMESYYCSTSWQLSCFFIHFIYRRVFTAFFFLALSIPDASFHFPGCVHLWGIVSVTLTNITFSPLLHLVLEHKPESRWSQSLEPIILFLLCRLYSRCRLVIISWFRDFDNPSNFFVFCTPCLLDDLTYYFHH